MCVDLGLADPDVIARHFCPHRHQIAIDARCLGSGECALVLLLRFGVRQFRSAARWTRPTRATLLPRPLIARNLLDQIKLLSAIGAGRRRSQLPRGRLPALPSASARQILKRGSRGGLGPLALVVVVPTAHGAAHRTQYPKDRANDDQDDTDCPEDGITPKKGRHDQANDADGNQVCLRGSGNSSSRDSIRPRRIAQWIVCIRLREAVPARCEAPSL